MTSLLLLLQENRSSPPSKRLGVPLRRRRDASVFYWPFFSRKMKTHTATFFVLMMINFCGPPSSLPFGPKGKWTAKASWQQSVSVSPLLFEKPPERTAVFFQPNFELSSTSTYYTDTCEPTKLRSCAMLCWSCHSSRTDDDDDVTKNSSNAKKPKS